MERTHGHQGSGGDRWEPVPAPQSLHYDQQGRKHDMSQRVNVPMVLEQRVAGHTNCYGSEDPRKHAARRDELAVDHYDACEDDDPGSVRRGQGGQNRMAHLFLLPFSIARDLIFSMPRRIARTEMYLLLGSIVLAALATAIFLAAPLTARQAKPRPSLEVRVADANGRMRLDWNANDPAIQSAQGATLEVEDGGVLNRYPVEPNVLRSGGLDYVRRSEDVLLTLTLYHEGRPGVQTAVRRIPPVQLQVAQQSSSRGVETSRSRTR